MHSCACSSTTAATTPENNDATNLFTALAAGRDGPRCRPRTRRATPWSCTRATWSMSTAAKCSPIARSGSRTGASCASSPGPEAAARDAKVVDWSRYTVLPGLMDMHTHIADEGQSADPGAPLKSTPARDAFIGARNAWDTVRAGFTTVRDVGTYRGFVDVALRDAINAGQVPGPRMYVAGAYITITGGGGEITGLPEGTVVPAEYRLGVADKDEEVRQKVNYPVRRRRRLHQGHRHRRRARRRHGPGRARVHRGGNPRRRRGGRAPPQLRRRARARRRGHQARGARRRALDRARLADRRRRHRADEAARHLAGRRHLQRRLHRHRGPRAGLVGGDPAQEHRDHARRQREGSARRWPPASTSPSAPTAASIRTATTRASSPTWCATA